MQNRHAFVLSALCLFTFTASTHNAKSQTPAIAPLINFTLPLADKTTAQAILLPTLDGRAFLVYATKTGQIGLYSLSPAGIPPTPTPTPPPEPPAKLAAVVTITETTPAPIAAAVQSALSARSATYFPFTIEMVALPTPPPNALLWIGRSAGKTYPYSFLADAKGVILWQGPTPKTEADYIGLIFRFSPTAKTKKACDPCPLH